MNIAEIKALITLKTGCNMSNVIMQGNKDEATGIIDTTWPSHFFMEERVKVVMHAEVFATICADREFAGLALKPVEIVAEQLATHPRGPRAAYRKFMIVIPKEIIGIL